MQGKFKFVTHAPVKRSYKRGFTTYYDRGSAYWIMSCTCKIVEKAPSPPAQFASMPHACQWAPFAARTAADRFCRLYSVPRSVGQAGDPGGVYLGEAAARVFTLCDFPLHVPGSLDVACRLLRELWIHRFRSSHMGFVISCPHGTLERDAEDQ